MNAYLISSSTYYYTNLFLAGIALAAFLIGLRLKTRHRELSYMHIYPLFSFLQIVIDFFGIAVLEDLNWIVLLNGISINLFLLIEYSTISHFYHSVVENKSLKFLIRLLAAIHSILFISSIVANQGIYFPINGFFLLQAIFIFLLIVIYFLEFLKQQPKTSLGAEPSFWITIGAMLYFLCTIPIYVGRRLILDTDGYVSENGLYSINFICYSIFYSLIIRAYLCKTPEKLY